MIRLLDKDLKRKLNVKRIINANRSEELNGENTLSFSASLTPSMSQYLDEDTVLELGDDYFDVSMYTKEQGMDGVVVDVEGEHVSYRLNDEEFDRETFVETGTPSDILEKILEDTGLNVGTVEFTKTMTYSVLEESSRRQILMGFIAKLDGDIDFDKMDVHIRKKRGSRDLTIYTVGKNVEVLSKVVDKRERTEDNKPLVSYTCKSIQTQNNTVGIGDDILLIHSSMGVKEKLRVVSYSYDPYANYSTVLEIANFIHGLEDELYDIVESTVAKEKMYNGVRIGPNDGFVAEGRVVGTDEIRSKTVMNATDGISIYSNTGIDGKLERNFYVDLDGRIKGKALDISGDATFQGMITGGSIDIGHGNFKVDKWGNMTAYNAYFEGDIASSDISGGSLNIGLGNFQVTRDGTLYAARGVFNGTISGGSITSDTTIDITTDASIGRNLYLNANSFNQGIYFNTFSETSITVEDPSGGIRITGPVTIAGPLYTQDGTTGFFKSQEDKIVRVENGLIVGIY